MRTRLAILALTAAVMSMPIAEAQAGFFTDVAKGAIKNAARHGKESARKVGEKVIIKGLCLGDRLQGKRGGFFCR
jgi:hypothetical protein